MARAIGISRVVVPPAPGLFSSFGLLYADVEHHYSRTFRCLLSEADAEALTGAWRSWPPKPEPNSRRKGSSGMRPRSNARPAFTTRARSTNCRSPRRPAGWTAPSWRSWRERFGQEHETVYGHRAGPEEPVELVNIAVVGRGLSDANRVPDRLQLPAATSTVSGSRKAYYGRETGWLDTPVISRADLATAHEGPVIVEEYDATCLVPPGARAERDRFGNIVIDL